MEILAVRLLEPVALVDQAEALPQSVLQVAREHLVKEMPVVIPLEEAAREIYAVLAAAAVPEWPGSREHLVWVVRAVMACNHQ